MADIDQPFVPIPKERLMLNVSKEKKKIEKVVEKIQYFITNNTLSTGKPGAAIGAAIYAGKELFKGGAGGRVIVFSSSQCLIGFGCTKPIDNITLLNTEQEKKLYTAQV